MTDRKKRQYLTPAQKKAQARAEIEKAERIERKQAAVLTANAHGWAERSVQLLTKALGAKIKADEIADGSGDPDFWLKVSDDQAQDSEAKALEPIRLTSDQLSAIIDFLVATVELPEDGMLVDDVVEEDES